MSGQQPLTPRRYDSLLAKGEDRKARILAVAQRLLARNGWRNTSLAQIAREAGVTTAGLLHHFESKSQLLHEVLDSRDNDDDLHWDREADLIEVLNGVADRFQRSPELIGSYTVLLIENLDPGAPLHERLQNRYRAAVESLTTTIRLGQRAGWYRTDLDPAVKAVEIIAFLNGMETTWLLDPSIPLIEAFRGYTRSLARELAPVAIP
ncbi:TetR/AcrR family transcriptional regulator [Nocardia pseudovaccinii]|uniref:TetR/AcrR family transcriptional regulator n=1 Tax=Nocardia pseudovaccinii TaxID=189540 RepID=UPI0007A534E2|nr:TetR/AcrR family transcriptional regulator [Nocardia pseudovaccinii]